MESLQEAGRRLNEEGARVLFNNNRLVSLHSTLCHCPSALHETSQPRVACMHAWCSHESDSQVLRYRKIAGTVSIPRLQISQIATKD